MLRSDPRGFFPFNTGNSDLIEKYGGPQTVSRYDDNTWAVFDGNGNVVMSGFFEKQDAYAWIESETTI